MAERGEEWVSWTSQASPHVGGRYTPRRWNQEEQAYEEQRVEARCSFVGCGAEFRRTCSSGRVRELIAKFAIVHLHRDPLEDPRRMISDVGRSGAGGENR